MKLIFKQRFFSWLDCYDIYDEDGNTVFTVEGKLSFGHCLHILDVGGRHIGTMKEVVLNFLPKFELYMNDYCIGSILKEFTFLQPKYDIDCNGWRVEGSMLEGDYSILERSGNQVAVIERQVLHFTDTYVIDVKYKEDALLALMVVLAIDVGNYSRN